MLKSRQGDNRMEMVFRRETLLNINWEQFDQERRSFGENNLK
jgi:hypothetical protein